MVEEEKASASASEVLQTLAEPVTEVIQTLDPNPASIQATVESVGTESTCNNAAESGVTDEEEEREKTLEFADELTQKASVFLKDCDFSEAVDCFSRALEIRVEHYGELAPECIKAYYKYGSALLEKAQAEADPLGNMPKKDGEAVQQESNSKNTANGDSVAASVVVSSDTEIQGSSSGGQQASDGKEKEEDGEDCQDDDISDADADADADEDESDLDMAWKMLDIARAITDKQSTDTMEKVDILCALAEISLEREDIESSLSDYKKALSILERLVEPDSRHIAELNFRICICVETGCQAKEAIPYCQKALLICKARMERLTSEIKCPSTVSDKSTSEKEAEIKTLSGLAEDLEKKLEDLKQQAENPKQLLAELMVMASSAKANGSGKDVATASSRMGNANTGKDLESPTVSTADTGAGGGGASSGVTHLGVVGRGVKRVLLNAESSPAKKLAPESSDKADGNSS